MPTRHYIVSGKVQGVGYRRFVEICAQQLGARGRVRNLRDGRVELVASATAEVLETLESELRRGPKYSRVAEIAINDAEEVSELKFAVAEDGDEPWQ